LASFQQILQYIQIYLGGVLARKILENVLAAVAAKGFA
jgi:hypothetical protein